MANEIKIDFLSGGGELGQLVRQFDWSKTSLGPLEHWPHTITTTLGTMLSSPVPMITLWGEDGVMIYNDAYAVVAGGRHPGLLGQPVREGWPEVSGFNDRVMRMVLAGGVLSYRDQEMVLNRSGEPEKVWFNLDYSPVYDETAMPIGVLAVVNETTQRVMAERDLKAAEAAREAERQRQLRLFEEAPGFILIVRGPDHVVEFVNATHQRLFGSADWIGKPLREAAPGASTALLDEVRATGEIMTIQGREVGQLPHLADGLRYITFMCAPLYDDWGTINGLFCEGFDVTDAEALRQREAALAELSARIGELADADELAGVAGEIVARTLRANRAGYGRVNQRAQTIEMLRDWTAPGVPSLEGPLPFAALGSSLAPLQKGELVVMDNIQTDPRHSGQNDEMLERLQIRAVMLVPVIEQGQLVAILAATDSGPRHWSADDIDFAQQVVERTRNGIERRRVETQLRRNEATLRFLDRLGQTTGALSSTSEILNATTRLLGEQLNVANCAYADIDEDADDVWIRTEWLAPNGPDLSIIGRYRLKDFGRTCGEALRAGRPFAVNDVGADLPPEDAKAFRGLRLGALITMPLVREGRLIALMAVHEIEPRQWSEDEIGLVREVAERSWAHIERARAEADRSEAERRLRAALEAKVNERTAALLQAKKSEALGRLTGGVAHDFSNILTAVLGNLEMLHGRVPDEPRLRQLIENATAAARRGAELTKRMQALAVRQPSGPTEPVELRRLIEAMGDLIGRTLGPMLTVETRIDPGLPAVRTNPQELEAALVDLLLQARDATNGMGHIQLSARYAEDAPADLRLASRSYVCLAVTDSGGTAMQPDADEGINLLMARGFAQEAGGTLRVARQGTNGSTAELWLPAAAAG